MRSSVRQRSLALAGDSEQHEEDWIPDLAAQGQELRTGPRMAVRRRRAPAPSQNR